MSTPPVGKPEGPRTKDEVVAVRLGQCTTCGQEIWGSPTDIADSSCGHACTEAPLESNAPK
jgi:hypothetical protein